MTRQPLEDDGDPCLAALIMDEVDDLYWDRQERKPHRSKLVGLTNLFVALYGRDGPVLLLLTAKAAWSAMKHRASLAALNAFYDANADDWIDDGSEALLAELDLVLLLTMQPRRELQSLAFSVRWMPFACDPFKRASVFERAS